MDETTLLWLAIILALVVLFGLRFLFNSWAAKAKVDTCPHCHGHIPKKTYRCPRCGWSQDTTDSGTPGIRLPG
jgi:hypothetical protein